MSKFDLTIAFDKAEYLNPQLYMLIDTLKYNIPEDCILHVVTNRPITDKIVSFILKNIKSKYYYNDGNKTKNLKSRCKYMFNCFDIKTDKEWVIKLEADLLILKNLNNYDKLLKPEYDLVIEPENRKIFSDTIAYRLWRIIYKKLNIDMPLTPITYRENNEKGLPLFGTGIVCIKSKHLDTINKRWINLTKICEEYINFNIHPNEFAFTAMAFDEEWKIHLYEDIYKFNPIGHFRKGDFPSTELVKDCKLPEDTIIFDYHRPKWLLHVAKYNPQLKNIIDKMPYSKKYIPESWWELEPKIFMESINEEG